MVDGNYDRQIIARTKREVGFEMAESSFPDACWIELVKACMAETGKSQRWAEVAVASTPEGRAAWGKARTAAWKRG